MLEKKEIIRVIKDAIGYAGSEDIEEAATEISDILEREKKAKQSQQPKLTVNPK